ncbi:MAG TPA: Ppx/GppA phosphatase family protein [Solirubrobacteraceae bacterium]|jgi:exopolyphosphatase/guanosine-5'-triphosphate,3'-diphosphate pyrophosphatase
MRVAVVDIGTNSTRLLIADVDAGSVSELDRRSIVTRLGEGVDATGQLGDAPQERVFAVLEEYAAAIEAAGCEARTAVMTSAVRDASNGAAFAARVRDRYGLEGRTLSGDEEANFSFRGATVGGTHEGRLLVVDIGGGSTELVVGAQRKVEFHVSTQAGVVRHSERHLHTDPPTPDELAALRADARGVIAAAVPVEVRLRVDDAIAVAGTATQGAAIDLGLEPYDPAKVEGHVLDRPTLDAQLALLASLPLEQRRDVRGLDPDRAPTIVAGVAILLEVLGAFELGHATVSERDILWGVALDLASG